LAIKFLLSMRSGGTILSERAGGHDGVPKENCRP
jgi:hypothetical protein